MNLVRQWMKVHGELSRKNDGLTRTSALGVQWTGMRGARAASLLRLRPLRNSVRLGCIDNHCE